MNSCLTSYPDFPESQKWTPPNNITLEASPDETHEFCHSSIQPRNRCQSLHLAATYTTSVYLFKCFSQGILYSSKPQSHLSPFPTLLLHRPGVMLGVPTNKSWKNILAALLPSVYLYTGKMLNIFSNVSLTQISEPKKYHVAKPQFTLVSFWSTLGSCYYYLNAKPIFN